VFSGLPVLDVAPLRARFHGARPWWAALSPGLAVRAVRRSLERRLEPGLSEYVALYDHQLQAWLKSADAQLRELYETQAGVFREQARRLAADGNETGEAANG